MNTDALDNLFGSLAGIPRLPGAFRRRSGVVFRFAHSGTARSFLKYPRRTFSTHENDCSTTTFRSFRCHHVKQQHADSRKQTWSA